MKTEEEEFAFEGTHILRLDDNYSNLMKHLAVLCSLRVKVHSQIDLIENERKKAIANPLIFLESLKNGTAIFPESINIPEIPEIDFSKYGENYLKLQSESSSPSSLKSLHTNFWTSEEQKKLEELLHKFPPETIESNRFKKIANALGNRSISQVASRVQKFFKKLHEANLPIPGTASCRLRNRNIKTQKLNLRLERPTTFFPERIIPKDLLMKDDTDEEQLFAPKDDETKLLALLKRIRNEKLNSSNTNYDFEIECSDCKLNLTSKKWLCEDCKINFCGDCIVSQLLNSSFRHLHHSVK